MRKLSEQVKEQLIQSAKEAKKNAYAPFSGLMVGAALLTQKGKVYKGCNVENSSYGLTNCAERNALTSAIVQGERAFQAIAVVSNTVEPISPCGACRQVLTEFASDLHVICVSQEGTIKEYSLKELLPHYFRLPKNSL